MAESNQMDEDDVVLSEVEFYELCKLAKRLQAKLVSFGTVYSLGGATTITLLGPNGIGGYFCDLDFGTMPSRRRRWTTRKKVETTQVQLGGPTGVVKLNVFKDS